MSANRRNILIAIGLISLTILIFYSPALNNGLLDWDDTLYVVNNPYLIGQEDFTNVFTDYYAGNYQPLTLLVYKVVFVVNGASPKAYHVLNIIFHLFTALLVFYFVLLLIEKYPVALITALLFALHPLHVESVAWISGLKDVQYGLFFFLSLILYLKYAKDKRTLWYLLSLLFFSISLGSKGQAVSLSLVVVAIDYLLGRKLLDKRLILEKIPFFLMSLIFGLIAYWAQDVDQNIQNYDQLSFPERIPLACYALTNYSVKLIIPFNLSAFYSYPVLIGDKIPGMYWSFLLVVPIVIYVLIRAFKRSRLIFFGIVFFLVNIVLLLQLIPVGKAIMADRYTYIASVGFHLAIVSLVLNRFTSSQAKTISFIVIGLYLITMGVLSSKYSAVWKTDYSLWNHAAKSSPDDPYILLGRGCALNQEGNYLQAIPDFDWCIAIAPMEGLAYFNRGISKIQLNKVDEALKDFQIADTLYLGDRYLDDFYVSWGRALAQTGKYPEALEVFDRAEALNPKKALIFNNRGIAKAMSGDSEGALKDFDKALSLSPDYQDAKINRDRALKMLGR